jgi:hypothetical protein
MRARRLIGIVRIIERADADRESFSNIRKRVNVLGVAGLRHVSLLGWPIIAYFLADLTDEEISA